MEKHALQYNLSFLPYEQYLIFQQLRLNKCTVNLQMPKLTTQMLRFTNGRVPGTTEHPPLPAKVYVKLYLIGGGTHQ